MEGHILSRSAVETCGANFTYNTNAIELQITNPEFLIEMDRPGKLQPYQEFDIAFQDLQKDVRNDKKLLEFVDNYYVYTLKTPSLQQGVSTDPFTFRDFLNHSACVYEQHSMMRETLQSFDNSSDEKLNRIDTWTKVSAVLFAVAAAIIAAIAAASAAKTKKAAVAGTAAAMAILLLELNKWIRSLLEKRESEVKKQKKIIGVMIFGVENSIKDLNYINQVSRRLQLETESISETVDDDRKKLAAMKKSFGELRGKANEYSRNMRLGRQIVLQSIIN